MKELSKEMRELLELLEDLTSRIRNGATKREIGTMLETATDECERLEEK
jgi:hypothetical protein